MSKIDESFDDSIDEDIQPQIINLQREPDTSSTPRIVNLRIINAENVKEESSNKKFTRYHIELKQGELIWTVQSRFSVLLQLKKNLKSLYPELHPDLPKFPKKELWGSTKLEVVLKRILMIERYLNAVINHPTLIQAKLVTMTLSIPPAVVGVVTKQPVENMMSFVRRTSLKKSNDSIFIGSQRNLKASGSLSSSGEKSLPDDSEDNLNRSISEFPVEEGGHVLYNQNNLKILIEYLKQKGLSKEEIFERTSPTSLIQQVENALMQTKDLSGADIYAIANTLKGFIKQMHKPDGLLSPYSKFIQISDLPSREAQQNELKSLVAVLPFEAQYVLRSVISLMVSIHSNASENKMNFNKLIPALAPCFVEISEEQLQQDGLKLFHILKLMLDFRACLFSSMSTSQQYNVAL